MPIANYVSEENGIHFGSGRELALYALDRAARTDASSAHDAWTQWRVRVSDPERSYGNLLVALRDPAHTEHEDMTEWAPPGFDAEAFDIEETTDMVRSARPLRGF